MVLKIGCANKVLERVEAIEDLLENRKFGLAEIKDEVRDIEKALDNLPPSKGPLSTGPFFIRTGENNAVNVKVQNVGRGCVDAVVKLFDIECCPPRETDCETLNNIGSCCAEDAVLNAPAGDFEVVICPRPDHASIRAFVSVHTGASPNSAFEYVIKASEMLPVVCPFCKKEKDPCHRDPCRDRCDC